MKRKLKKLLFIVAGIILVLVLIRLFLPVIAENLINSELSQLKHYEGHIEDVDLFLIAGQYSIEGLVIKKKDSNIENVFLKVDEIKAKLQWHHVFKGEIAGQLILDNPVINFATEEDGKTIQSGKDENWIKTVNSLIPVRINEFAINKGEIHYQDFSTEPKIDLFMNNLNLQMTNIGNIVRKDKALPANFTLSGTTIGGGKIHGDGGMYLLKHIPDIDINLSIENVDITALNDFLRAYTNTDAHNGIFNLFIEIAIDGGNIAGYVKPVIRNLEIFEWKKEQGPFFARVWEGIVGVVAEIFENQDKDQLATRVPLAGNVDNIETGVWPAVWSVLKNTFFEAFSRSAQGSINFGDA